MIRINTRKVIELIDSWSPQIAMLGDKTAYELTMDAIRYVTDGTPFVDKYMDGNHAFAARFFAEIRIIEEKTKRASEAQKNRVKHGEPERDNTEPEVSQDDLKNPEASAEEHVKPDSSDEKHTEKEAITSSDSDAGKPYADSINSELIPQGTLGTHNTIHNNTIQNNTKQDITKHNALTRSEARSASDMPPSAAGVSRVRGFR